MYYPKLVPAANGTWLPQYCSSVSGNCDDGSRTGGRVRQCVPAPIEIHGQGGGLYPAYRITVALNSALGEYYGIQGTTWTHPPIFNGKSRRRTSTASSCEEFYNGAQAQPRRMAHARGVYWVSNTLDGHDRPPQIVGIAASLTRAPKA